MKFMCYLDMAFSLTKPIWVLICLHDVTGERAAALTDHFSDAFVRKNHAHLYDVAQYDVRKFDSDAILFREI